MAGAGGFGIVWCLVMLVADISAQGRLIFHDDGGKPRDGSACWMDGSSGRCSNVQKCPPLMRLLRERPPGFVGRLRSAAKACRGPPLLCCAFGGSSSPGNGQPQVISPPPRPSIRGADRFISPRECGESSFSPPRVIGGKDVQSKTTFPWMAALKYRASSSNTQSYRCGGAVINERWVLTAAHCITNDGPIAATVKDLKLMQTIDDDFRDPPEDMEVERIFKHPDFFRRGRMPVNDIALLKLKKTLTFSAILKPLCVNRRPQTASEIEALSPVYIAGWGHTEFGSSKISSVMQWAAVNVTDFNTCVEKYRRVSTQLDTAVQMCAGGDDRNRKGCAQKPEFCRGGVDSCRGDSGGPLMKLAWVLNHQKWKVIGIVSFGTGCGNPDRPGVYTRLGPFLGWIGSTVNNN